MKTLKLNIKEYNIWFTSDTHFNHKNIIKYCDRPFNSVREMDGTMIENWNNLVEPNDIVFHAGDFCFGQYKTWKFFTDALNGRIYLSQGNHDKDNSIPRNTFERIEQFYNLLIQGDEEISQGQRITVCHYPMLSWYHSHRGSWQLFGHVHGALTNTNLADDGFNLNGKLTPNQLDIGVDVHDFEPISYEQVKLIITKQNLRKEE